MGDLRQAARRFLSMLCGPHLQTVTQNELYFAPHDNRHLRNRGEYVMKLEMMSVVILIRTGLFNV